MVARLLDEISANPPKEILALTKLVELAAQEGPYRELLNSISNTLPNFEKRKSLLENGYFDTQDFLQLLHACGDGKGTGMAALMPLLRRLIEWGLVVDHSMFGSHAFVSHCWEQSQNFAVREPADCR
jgi:hypothetical protein